MIDNNDITYILADLENAGSKDMAVDGSISNVTFSYSVPASEDQYLYAIDLFLLDDGIMSHNKFGSIAELTTGISIKVKTNFEDTVIRDMKNNVDILMSFTENKIVGNSTASFLNEDDYFLGTLRFPIPIRLNGDTSDKVKIIIKDDLTGLDVFRAQARLKKVF
jgi:hypothetical protein